jgi:hypothetical protein
LLILILRPVVDRNLKNVGEMRSVLKILLLVAVAFSTGELRAGRIDSLQMELAEFQNKFDHLYRRRDSLEHLTRVQSEEVELLKHKLEEGKFSPVERFRLENSLRASQILADSLDELSLAISEQESSISRLYREGERLCAMVIDSLGRLSAGSRSISELRDNLRELDRYRLLRAGFSQAIADTFSDQATVLGAEEAVIEIEPGDAPEDILEKADFLSDMADKWEGRLALVNKRIERLDEERLIRQQIGEFTQEISLFDRSQTGSRARVESSETGTRNESPTPSDQEVYGPGRDTDVQIGSPETETSRDLGLYNPETVLGLSESVGALSVDDLEDFLKALHSRQDSLTADLDSLRVWAQRLRLKARDIDRERKESPRE